MGRDLRLCAALVCCQESFSHYPGYYMCAKKPRCNSWANDVADFSYYEAAVNTARCIEAFHNLDGVHAISATSILNFNIYETLRDMRRGLKEHGVVSEHGNGVNGPGDILGGIYYPTFIFLDTLLEKHVWRDLCPPDKYWISQQEQDMANNNLSFLFPTY